MANTVAGGAVVWNLDVDGKAFTAGLNKASSEANAFSKNLGRVNFADVASKASNSFNTIADGLARVGRIAATTLIGSGGVGALFLKSAADLEQTSRSMQVLTGNTEVANKLFAQLARYANTTPFEFPQIAKAGRTLLGFGITSDQVFRRVQILGDIAAATGADFEHLAVVYGQVNAAGRLMGQDSLQLINNNIPITNILTKKLGISARELRDRIEEGAITADIFNEALEDVTKQGGFAFKGVDVLAQSFNGRMSTLKDTVLEFGRNLIGVKVDPKLGLTIKKGGVFDILSEALPKITADLAKITPGLTKFVELLVRNGQTIVGILAGLTAAFVVLKVAAIGAGIAGGIAAGTISLPFLVVGGIIAAVVAALVFLQVRFDIFGKAWRGIVTAFEAGKNAIGAVVDFFASTFRGAIEGAKNILETLKDTAKTVWGGIKTAFEGIVNAGQAVWDGLEPVRRFVTFLTGGYMAGARLQLTILAGVIGFLADKAKEGFGKFLEIVKPVVDILKDSLGKAFKEVKDAISDTFNSFKAFSDVLDPFGKLIENIKQPLTELKDTFMESLVVPMKEAKRVFDEYLKPAGEEMARIWREVIVPAFNEVKKAWDEILKPVLDELWKKIDGPVLMALKVLGGIILAVVIAPLALLVAVSLAVIIAFAKIVEWGAKLFGWFVDFQVMLYNIVAAVVGFVVSIVAKFIELQTKITSAIWGAIVDINNFFIQLPGKIVRALGNLGGVLYNSGRELIQGLLDGAGSLLSRIGSFMVDKLPGAIKEPFKRALGIRSPSKVFAGYGKNIGEGLVQGISSAENMVRSAVGGLGLAASPSVVGSSLTAPSATGEDGTLTNGSGLGTTVYQTNHVYKEVDMEQNLRDLAWQIGN